MAIVMSCTIKLFYSVFQNELESIQYNACLGITGAIRGTWIEKYYQKLQSRTKYFEKNGITY